MGLSLALLICDRESEEIFYKEREGEGRGLNILLYFSLKTVLIFQPYLLPKVESKSNRVAGKKFYISSYYLLDTKIILPSKQDLNIDIVRDFRVYQFKPVDHHLSYN